VERSECCEVAPSRGTARGVPTGLLQAAWREAAESGPASCVLVPRDGVLTIGWVNRTLSDLLGVDAAQLAGQPLREVCALDPEPAADPSSSEPSVEAPGSGSSATPAGPEQPAAGIPHVPAQAGSPERAGRELAGWARTAHQLARLGSGRGVARLRRLDDSVDKVQITVTPIGVQAQGRPSEPTVTPVGTVGELPAPEGPPAWLVTLDPLTDRAVDAEAARAAAEHRFDALAASAPVGIFASDVGLRLGYVNDRFLALTGREAHALLGTGWLEAIHPEDSASLYAAVQTVLSGTPVELAVRLAEDGDEQRWLQLRLAPTTTPVRAAGFIGTAEDVTRRRSWEEHITYQALHDPLTGLVNRRRLVDVLSDQLASRRGRDRDFAVLFLDLDGFKAVNDTYGHDIGDRALIEVARRMQRVARESDVLARVAGDEFVVVLRNIMTGSEAEAAARRHLKALGAPLRIGRLDLALSASIGVAMPGPKDTPDSLLRTADRVMYEAKAAGSGLYRLADATDGGNEQ
jgi:diguanylate cyclase (GGDEF)-like protein/PAS domain S-box-containing protein